MSRAEDLLANAPKDPTTVLAAAEAYLGELTVDEHAERSISHRAASIAARPTDIDKAVDHGEMAMACARDGGWEELRLGAALTLAGSYAIAGRSGEALELLEGEDPKGYPLLRARFLFQKGALLQHVGRVSEATDAFEGVLPQFRESGDVEAVAMTANRLGMLMTSLGRLREAEVYLGEALGIQEELGHHAAIHGTHHNLGMVAAFQGDIPLALDRLQRSDELFMKTTGATAPQHVARCVVLANVGLFAEAERLATRVAYACRDRGDSEHEGNALLVASHSALLGTRYERAKGLADRAGAIFSEDGRKPSALDATRVSLDARFALEGASMGLLEEVEEVARQLSAASDPLAAAQSDLLAGRIALELGLHDRARASLQKSAGVHHGTLEVRLNAQLARALVAISEGDSRRADASARAGIKLIDDYQRTLGATDLRMGLDRQAAELGELGLGLALESGSPRRVLVWMERR
ncbi:MAG: tetratricopeptide repeat protein, partial [Acidimicrobiia bacterium]